MPRVELWFRDWLDGHLARHPRADWGDPDDEIGAAFFGAWRSAFVRSGLMDEALMAEASERLAATPPRFPADHLPALLKAGKELYQSRGLAPGAAPDDRDSAALASLHCEYCSGQGMAVAYASKPDPGRRNPESASAYCACALGRWIERSHRETSPDVRRRTPDLADVIANRSSWLLDPPWMTREQGSRNLHPAEHPLPRRGAPAPSPSPGRWAAGLGKLPEFVPGPGKPSPQQTVPEPQVAEAAS